MKLAVVVIGVALGMAVLLRPGGAEPPAAPAHVSLPLAFAPNEGQAPARFDFVAGNIGLSAHGAALGGRGSVALLGAAASAPRALAPLPGRVNHLVGDDPAHWHTDIPTFARVRYGDVWPGIDVVWHGDQRRLEYDFVVAPSADPSRIAVRATVPQADPIAYQDIDGERRGIDVAFDGSGFKLGAYDHTRRLVIDPVVLASSTYLGGGALDIPYDVAVDSTGIYITGLTDSTNFDTRGGVEGNEAGTDAFIAKLNPAGNALVYATYLGGNGTDEAHAIALDSAGFAYVVGTTGSTDFNTVNPIEGNSPGLDVFVAKLNPAGNTLAYSTYLGGSDNDRGGFGIAVDSTLAAYVVGSTDSTDFDTNNPIQTDDTSTDGFVAKLTAPGNALAYATYLGGDGEDFAENIGIDPIGSAYVTGTTGSTDFATVDEIEGDQPGDDAFITKLNPPGTAIAYSTYLGGNALDTATGIAVRSNGEAFIAGDTESTDFNTLNRYEGDQGGRDGFVARLRPSGALASSTYLGGSGFDRAFNIAIDGVGAMYVVGETGSADFDLVGEYEGDSSGTDAYVTKVAPGGTFLSHSTYLGGNGVDVANSIAVDSAFAYVTGVTGSSDFDTRGAIEGDSGLEDAFITRFSFTSATPPPQPTATPSPLPTPEPLPPPVALGTSGADRLRGTAADDTMCGLGGNDTVSGFRGDDRLFGDACGRGILALARAGNDQLNGGAGADRLVGGGGNDVIRPGPGRDRIKAGSGRDRIRAHDGTRDRVRCGPGDDAVTADRRDRLRGCERVTRP